jgi:hypothetical protein
LNQSILLIVYKLSQQISEKLQAARAVVVVVVVVVIVVVVVDVVVFVVVEVVSSSVCSMILTRQPPLSQSLLIHEVSRSHITTHHTRQDSSG